MLPEEGDETHAWPRAALLAFARAAYPRAAGVLLDLKDDSITGEIVTTVTQRSPDVVSGTFHGEVRLSSSLPEERGRRESYRPFRSATLELTGDFAFDPRSGAFTRLRLVSTSGTGCFEHGPRVERLPYAVAAELVR